MKRNSLPVNDFSVSEIKSPNQKIADNQFNQSPYLKAVLSEKKIAGPAQVFSIINSSMTAALRYISQSRQNA
jgi:hypothetical protein